MTIQGLCLGISGVLGILAFVPYIAGVIRRTLIPEKATWIVWWVVDVTGFLSMVQQHAVNLQMPAVLLGSTVTNVLAFRFGKPGWTRLDKVCFAGAAVAIAAWVLSGDARFGLIGFIVCNWIGFVPTLRAAWIEPATQKNPTWWVNLVGSAFAIAGMPAWTFAHAATPLTFLLMAGTILGILYLRPAALRAAS